MIYRIFKKLFYRTAVALVTIASFPALAPVCFTGNQEQIHALKKAQEKRQRLEAHTHEPYESSAASAETFSDYSRINPAHLNNFTMVPAARGQAARTAQTPLIPRPAHLDAQQPLMFRASPPLPAQTTSLVDLPEMPGIATPQAPQAAPLSPQHTALKMFLKPFAYASSKLRAIDPSSIIEKYIMKAVHWVTGFFGSRMLKKIDADMAPMIMNVVHMGAAMAAQPLVNMVKGQAETMTEFVNGKFGWVGEKTGIEFVKRSSDFVGVFFREYFMTKTNQLLNVGMLKKQIDEAKDKPLDTQTLQEMNDTMVARLLILGGNIVHLLGDLHNLLFIPQSRGNDAIDQYLKMSRSVTTLAAYTLYTYQHTTRHAVTLSDDMQKYLASTISFLNLIQATERSLRSFKDYTDSNGTTPLLLMFFGKNIQEDMTACQPGADMLGGQMNGLLQMFAQAATQKSA